MSNQGNMASRATEKIKSRLGPGLPACTPSAVSCPEAMLADRASVIACCSLQQHKLLLHHSSCDTTFITTFSCRLVKPAVLQQLQLFSPAAAPPMHPTSLRPLLQTAAPLPPASALLHGAAGVAPPQEAEAGFYRSVQRMGCQWCAAGRLTHPPPLGWALS